MSTKISSVLTVVLPYSPDDREAHEKLVAAACGLLGNGGWSALQVLQLTPHHGRIEPKTATELVEWWDVECAFATEDADVETLATVAHAALATPELAAGKNRCIVLPAGPVGEELAVLLAAKLDVPALGRCVDLISNDGEVVAHRMAYGGRLSLELRTTAENCCVSWRPQTDIPSVPLLEAARSRQITVQIAAPLTTEAQVLPSADRHVPLEGARLVVSGGRGMAGPEGFELLSRIAASLDAALAGSLPAVDAGWVPVARQVGQSGRFVSPQLYLAIGISGTPQHMAGIADTTRIVAVNQDPEAPIFAMADVGVVGDWRELLPQLADNLEALRSGAGE